MPMMMSEYRQALRRRQINCPSCKQCLSCLLAIIAYFIKEESQPLLVASTNMSANPRSVHRSTAANCPHQLRSQVKKIEIYHVIGPFSSSSKYMHQLLLMNTLETDSSIANSYEYLGAEHVRNRFPFSRYFNINTRQSGKSIQVVTHKLPLQNSAIFQSSTGSSSSRLSVIRVTTNQIRPRQHHRHPVLLYLLSIHYPATRYHN